MSQIIECSDPSEAVIVAIHFVEHIFVFEVQTRSTAIRFECHRHQRLALWTHYFFERDTATIVIGRNRVWRADIVSATGGATLTITPNVALAASAWQSFNITYAAAEPGT